MFGGEFFLGLARLLAESPSQPPDVRDAALRTAVSRAYYAAFLCTRDQVDSMSLIPFRPYRKCGAANCEPERNGRLPDGGRAHRCVQCVLRSRGDDALALAGNALHRMHKRRTWADYDRLGKKGENEKDRPSDWPAAVESTLADADVVLSALRSSVPLNPRSA